MSHLHDRNHPAMSVNLPAIRFRPRAILTAALVAIVLAGCDAPDARFRLDMVNVRVQELRFGDYTPDHLQQVSDALTAMFGTPDEPYLVPGSGMASVVNLSNVQRAAGPVRRDESGLTVSGLFREHCVHCHGVTGDGAGPTALFLNPYPRDYRMGIFKFKSTPKGAKPTHDDLLRILTNGVPGTAMPSFKTLTEGELEALVDYVKYLAIRGEVERDLYTEIGITGELELSKGYLVDTALARVVGKWQEAPERVTEIPQRPDFDVQESIARGRELFYGGGACVTCHGPTQLGDGTTNDYDDWTKEWYQHADDDSALAAEFMHRGAMPPRNILPRNLRQGVYRGGRRPIDIYLRIANGIDGAPMPGASAANPQEVVAGQPSASLSSDDIWHLVNYVRSLPYDELSRPTRPRESAMRERL